MPQTNKQNSKKQVKIRTSHTFNSKDLYFGIYDYVKRLQKLPVGLMPKQNLNYYVSKLVTLGVIKKIGYAVWKANDKKWEEFNTQRSKNNYRKGLKASLKVPECDSFTCHNKIRGHGFVFKIKIPQFKSWEKRVEYLKQIKYPYEMKSMGKGSVPTIQVGDKIVWLANKNIIIYYNKSMSFYANSATESESLALADLNSTLVSIENLLKVSIKVNKKYDWYMVRHHYAKVNDSLAKKCNDDGTKIQCKGDDGKVWMSIDNSLNMNELETQHQQTAKPDMDEVVVPFFNDLKKMHDLSGQTFTISELLKTMNAGVIANNMAISTTQNGHNSLVEVVKAQAQLQQVLINEVSTIAKAVKLFIPKTPIDEPVDPKNKPYYTG